MSKPYRIKGQVKWGIARASGYSGGWSGTISPGEYAQAKWDERFNWSALFAYCFRRFGMPLCGGDDLKEIATWYVDTPMDGVALWIKPYAGKHEPASLSFGYGVSKEVNDVLFGEDVERGRQMCEQVNRALEAAMDDLERPVSLRDMALNCFGRVDWSQKGLRREVRPSVMAGYGVGLEFLQQIKKWQREDAG